MTLDLIFLILFIYFGFIFFLILFRFLYYRGKIRINILTAIGKIIVWRKPIFEGNKIYAQIRKENKRKFIPEWKAELTQIHDFSKWFGRRGRETYIMPEASETITFDFKGNGIIQPMWDKQQSTRYIYSKVLTEEGRGEKLPIPMWILYVTLLTGIASAFFGFLIYLKLGAF